MHCRPPKRKRSSCRPVKTQDSVRRLNSRFRGRLSLRSHPFDLSAHKKFEIERNFRQYIERNNRQARWRNNRPAIAPPSQQHRDSEHSQYCSSKIKRQHHAARRKRHNACCEHQHREQYKQRDGRHTQVERECDEIAISPAQPVGKQAKAFGYKPANRKKSANLNVRSATVHGRTIPAS